MIPAHMGSQDTLCFFKRTEGAERSTSDSSAFAAARGARARAGQDRTGQSPRTRPVRPEAQARARPEAARAPLTGPSGSLGGALPRRRTPPPGRARSVQPPAPGQGPGASPWRSPVVLRLEELELFFDAVQRLRDGEFERLARSLVRGLAGWRHGREMHFQTRRGRPAGKRRRRCPPRPGRRDGESAQLGLPPPQGAAHLLPTFPSLIYSGAEVNRAAAPAHPFLPSPSTRKRGVPAPPRRPPPRRHSLPFRELCSADAAWPGGDPPLSFPRQISCPRNKK